MDEDHLVVRHGEVDLLLEDGDFVAGVFVQADLADAEDVGAIEKVGDDCDDFAASATFSASLGLRQSQE